MHQQEMLPSTQALISLPSFHHNLDVVRNYIGPRPAIMAVVKANAYGHGVEVLAHEALHAGASMLGVARVQEAIELRRAGIDVPILVFELPPADQIGTALFHQLTLTVSTPEGAAQVSATAERIRQRAVVHAKVDTGMTRLGFHYQDAAPLLAAVAKLPGISLEGVYSHFATSDEEDLIFARTQLDRFLVVVEELKRLGVNVAIRHMANSGAIIALPESHLDMVRPGIMLYGYAPRPGMVQKYPLQPVMSLVSRIALVKTVAAGVAVSYGRRYYTPGTTRIATVPIGYADGYSRLLTNKATALINGIRYPVVGTICMDQLMVDLGPEGGGSEGDRVVLIGSSGKESINADDIAALLGTISYEVTCLITKRVPRVFVEA
jgi:alanine racemase